MREGCLIFHHISLQVSDLELCLEFYRQLFALEPCLSLEKTDGCRIVHLSCPERSFILELIEGEPSVPTEDVHLGFSCRSFDEALETLKRQGVRFVRGPIRVGREQIVFVRDPAGYLIEINDGLEET